MATIKDIANKLGISPGTVSKGLNGASDISESMRQKVLDTALDLGYIPMNMRQKVNPKVCIMVENMNYESIDQFGYELIAGFQRAAGRRHWDVTIIQFNEQMQSNESYDSYMLKNEFHGAFLLGFNLYDDYMRQLAHTSVPTVLLDNYIAGNKKVGYVGSDNYEGIEDALTHLKALGHSSIALLNGTKQSMVSKERYTSFIRAMEVNDLLIDPNLIAYGEFNIETAKDYVPKFLEEGATAILCASDLIASGVITEVSNRGLRVPEDISIIGYDDIPISRYLNPPLTTIHQDRTDLGKSAFLLLDGLMHDVAISKLLLRPELVVRSSTGPAKNS